jgi:hypothetical protein
MLIEELEGHLRPPFVNFAIAVHEEHVVEFGI